MNELERPKGPVRVLIVDDHPLFRAGIKERLESVPDLIEVVGEAGDGTTAHRLVATLNPDVVLMDISMPGVNGIEATKLIHADFPEVDVIILSVYEDGQYVHAALAAGASGYLLKTVEANELREAVIRVAAGQSALSPSVARTVLTGLSGAPAQACPLSDRELQVLELAAHGASNKAIAKDLFLSTRTVEAHMRSIFDKLRASSRTEAVAAAVRHEWIRLVDVR